MQLPTLLVVVALVVIVFALYLLFGARASKTTLKIAKIGELSTTSLGLVTLVIGAVLAYFCVQLDQKREATAQAGRASERQDAAKATPPAPSVSVSQSSTGDGSPNIGVVYGGTVTTQVDKSRAGR